MRILTAFAFTALLSTPAFSADLGTYRPGTPYSSSVAAGADVCQSQCAGDAQCRGWNYVKPNPNVSGVCEFLSSVSAPVSSAISISGQGYSAIPSSSRLTSGGTNTVRVGTSVAPASNTVTVGQTPSGRRIVRQAPPRQVQPQTASTPRLQNQRFQDMSLTEQQNLYRQGGQPQAQPRPQPQTRPQIQPGFQPQPPASNGRPSFQPLLDAPGFAPVQRQGRALPQYGQPFPPQTRAVSPQIAPQAAPQGRRATGPRNLAPPTISPTAQSPFASNRPPIGQPIVSAPPMPRRSVADTQAPVYNPAASQTPSNVAALSPDQARRSLFGRLNDDVKPATSPEATPSDMPIATSVPSIPVTSEPMELLAGGR